MENQLNPFAFIRHAPADRAPIPPISSPQGYSFFRFLSDIGHTPSKTHGHPDKTPPILSDIGHIDPAESCETILSWVNAVKNHHNGG